MRLLHRLTPELMQDADRLEGRYYGADHMAGWQKSMEWQKAFPWMSAFMEDQGNIVAFVDLLPVIADQAVRGQGVIHRLLQDRIAFYADMRTKGFEFPVVCTENFTADGCGFSQRQGWELMKEKSPTHRIYQVDWAVFQKTWI